MAFGLEHRQDVARRPVAEQLTQSFFVIGDAVLFDQRDEIGWGVARQGRLGKMRIGGNEILGLAVEVGEIAPPAARNQDFLAQSVGALEHGDTAAALAGFDGAHQAGRAATEDECVEGMGHEGHM